MSTQVTVPDSPPVVPPRDPQEQPTDAARQRDERRKSFPDLLTFLKNTCKKIEAEDKSERDGILRQQNQCQGYYDGKQNGQWTDRNEWEESTDPQEIVYKDNRYKEQIDKLQMEMARSYPELGVEPTDKTDTAKQEATEFIKSRIDANRKRLFIQRPEFVLSENMALLLKTITYRYTYFDKQAPDGQKETRPKFDKTTVGEERGVSLCAVCGIPQENEAEPNADGEIAPSPCPQCGSTSTKTIQTSPVELELPSGEEEVPCGLPRCVHVDPMMVQVSLNARNMEIASTPYVVWTQMVERGKLEQMFPDKVIPTGDAVLDDAARYRRENEASVSNSPYLLDYGRSDTKGGEQFQRLRFKLIWLDAWIYSDYSDSKPVTLPDGRTLPPDTPLIQLFPRGMCIAKVGETILALYHEDKNKKWSVCVYGLREHAFHGAGTNALIPNQKNINDLLSYRMSNIWFNTARREFVNSDKIDGGNLPPLSKACNVSNLDSSERIVGNAYDVAPGTPLPPEVVLLSSEQYGSLQEQAGTSSLLQEGTAAQALSTATGIAAMRDMSVGRIGPNLMLKASMEVETAFQILEHEQKNYSKQHLFELAGLRPDRPAGNLGYTARGVEAFINSDLRADFNIVPVQGSWMPVTEQEKKADAMAMAEIAGKVQDPELLGQLAKTFKQPLQLGGSAPSEREAARRLEEFGRVAQLLASQGIKDGSEEVARLVLSLATNAQMDDEMDNHTAFIKFYKDWWVSDESRNAPPSLKAAVKMRTQGHRNAIVQEATMQNAEANVAQIPNKLAEVAGNKIDGASQAGAQTGQVGAQNEQANLEQGRVMSDREHAAQVEVDKQAASNQLAAQDREHELQTNVADREHAAIVKQQNASPSAPA